MSEKDFTIMHSRNMQQVSVTQRITKVLALFITYAFLIVMALIVLFPFYWMIISSLKSLDEYRASVPTFWPRMVLISNYADAFSTGNLGRLFLNTAYVGIVSTMLSLIITILTAFAFARLEFKGKNALFGALLAVIVLMLFLRDFRPTIIVALSIPISLLLAVVLMHFTGVTLNIISLSGLALGVGMLVDNSIVAIENIYRLRQLGYNAATAAVHGCRQIAGAITASTLTTVCVFVPILFTSGLTRQIFADMGLTIAYSLMASLLIALTLVPSLSSLLLGRVKQKPEGLFGKFVS